MTTNLLPGVYRHYKGRLYKVVGLAYDANADSLYDRHPLKQSPDYEPIPLGKRVVVVYYALRRHGRRHSQFAIVRTLEDFTAWIQLETEQVLPASTIMLADEPVYQRFTYLGPHFTTEMLP